MIRAAKISEIPDIIHITKACARSMIANEIYQWNEHYPSASIFEKDSARNELYVLEIDEKIIGSIVISTLMDEEYAHVKWLTPNTANFYIHRLAVHPDFQKKGYAQQLMTFAEKMAQEQSIPSIRLDTFSQNLRNQKFYENRGYQRLEDITYPKQSAFPFHCYELVL